HGDEANGHVGWFLINLLDGDKSENVYLFDSSLFFYLTKDSGGHNNAFGEAPKDLRIDDNGLMVQISPGKKGSNRVILLNGRDLQGNTGDCGFFSSEFAIYVLNHFRQAEDVERAFRSNSELLMEIASKVSMNADTPRNRTQAVVTATNYNSANSSKYNEFLIGNASAGSSVWILKSNEAEACQSISLLSVRQAALQDGINMGYAACDGVYKQSGKKNTGNYSIGNCRKLVGTLFSVSGIVYEKNCTGSNTNTTCKFVEPHGDIDELKFQLGQSYIRDSNFGNLLRRGDVEIAINSASTEHIIKESVKCSGAAALSTVKKMCSSGIIIDYDGTTATIPKSMRASYDIFRSKTGNPKQCEGEYECWKSKNPTTLYIKNSEAKHVNKETKKIVDELRYCLEDANRFVDWEQLDEDEHKKDEHKKDDGVDDL
ncbi:MAG: hypothetical protein LBI29_01820, partial [Rickettsiales bacterium]|nr:hypothetical protein [Rickettsiales bacterium]